MLILLPLIEQPKISLVSESYPTKSWSLKFMWNFKLYSLTKDVDKIIPRTFQNHDQVKNKIKTKNSAKNSFSFRLRLRPKWVSRQRPTPEKKEHHQDQDKAKPRPRPTADLDGDQKQTWHQDKVKDWDIKKPRLTPIQDQEQNYWPK